VTQKANLRLQCVLSRLITFSSCSILSYSYSFGASVAKSIITYVTGKDSSTVLDY